MFYRYSPKGDLVMYTSKYYNRENIIIGHITDLSIGETIILSPPFSSHRTYGINAVLGPGKS